MTKPATAQSTDLEDSQSECIDELRASHYAITEELAQTKQVVDWYLGRIRRLVNQRNEANGRILQLEQEINDLKGVR